MYRLLTGVYLLGALLISFSARGQEALSVNNLKPEQIKELILKKFMNGLYLYHREYKHAPPLGTAYDVELAELPMDRPYELRADYDFDPIYKVRRNVITFVVNRSFPEKDMAIFEIFGVLAQIDLQENRRGPVEYLEIIQNAMNGDMQAKLWLEEMRLLALEMPQKYPKAFQSIDTYEVPSTKRQTEYREKLSRNFAQMRSAFEAERQQAQKVHSQKIANLEKDESAGTLESYVKKNDRKSAAKFISSRLPWKQMNKTDVGYWKRVIQEMIRPGLNGNPSEVRSDVLLYRGTVGSGYLKPGEQSGTFYETSRLMDLYFQKTVSSQEIFAIRPYISISSKAIWEDRCIGFGTLSKTILHSMGMGVNGNTSNSMLISSAKTLSSAAAFSRNSDRAYAGVVVMWKVPVKSTIKDFNPRQENEVLIQQPFLFPDQYLDRVKTAGRVMSPWRSKEIGIAQEVDEKISLLLANGKIPYLQTLDKTSNGSPFVDFYKWLHFYQYDFRWEIAGRAKKPSFCRRALLGD